MKWKKPKTGSIRIIKTFALIPLTVGDETRWFEFVKIEQSYNGYHKYWENNKFVN